MVKDYKIGPWGEVAADTGLQTRLKLAGQQYDQQTGLCYMRARYYDPALGRFLSEDPIGIEGGLNLYAYAGNDPVNMWDPYGLSPDDDCPSRINGKCTVRLPDIVVDSDPPGLPIAWLVPQPPTTRRPPSGRSPVRGGGGSGEESGLTSAACHRQIVATVGGAALSFVGLRAARSAKRAAAMLRRVERSYYPQIAGPGGSVRIVSNNAFAGTLGSVAGNWARESAVVGNLQHSGSAAMVVGGLNGVSGLELAGAALELGAGFIPGPAGAAASLLLDAPRIYNACKR